MRLAIVTIFVFLFTGFTTLAKAQQQIFENYTVNDGLVSNTIRKVFQDSKGFLWIASLEGLSKYDGHTFTNYTTANGLSHNMVNDFYETKEGRLYVALNNGSIDMITGDKVIPVVSQSTTVVNRFIHTPWEQVIATTDNNGLQNFSNGKLLKPLQDLPQTTFYDIVFLSDTSCVATSQSFVAIFNTHYKLLAKIIISDDPFLDIKVYLDSKKRIWIASDRGLRVVKNFSQLNRPESYTLLPEPIKLFSENRIRISDIFEDEEGAMWFATSAGIVKINKDSTQQIFTVKDGLSSNIVTSIFQDREKNIWFGTAVGLSKLVTKSDIRLYPFENGIFSSDNLYLMYPAKENSFLVGTSKTVELFNKLSGKFITVSTGDIPKIYGVISNTSPPLFIGSNQMATFDTLNLRFNKTNPIKNFIPGKAVSDKEGNFFLSDLDRLLFSSAKTQYKILDDRITAMLIDKAGYLWAGTWQNGLLRIRYIFRGNQFQLLAANRFLPGENIRCLFEDSKGNIWAGTRYQGVFRLSDNAKDGLDILHLDQGSGLTSNFIRGIREDGHGNFWIAFYNGLDKLIPRSNSLHIFNFSRVNNYFVSVVGLEIDDDNTLWLATGEGLVKIKDRELEKSPPLKVYITKMLALDSSYTLHEKIQLSYRENQVQFNYAAPGYINEKQILFTYRLIGSSAIEWSHASNQHNVSYAGLPAGKYRFEVKALGWNGVWGKPAVIDFFITPPFWQTWWFITLLSLFAFLIMYAFIKWRIKNIRAIEAEKLKVQKLHAEQYKSKLEMEQIVNYFSSSLIDKNTVDAVLWDVAKNLIGRLGFVDCMIYIWNDDKTKMIQKAGFGPKGSVEEISKQYFDVASGQGVVGYVMQTKEAVLIPDTSKDGRYRADEMTRLSEITVPIIYNNELTGVIDSEHHDKNFFTERHMQILNTIATLMANKIKSIEAEQSLQKARIEMYSINEQLSKAKLEALRSQMNPHFIFNCINSIDALIQSNDKYNATVYLNKFAKLIRSILDSSKKDTVSLATDVEMLKLYIGLEQLRNEDNFTAEIQVDDELLLDDYRVPPLIIQPFVENAILHGLRYRHDNDGRLSISITRDGELLRYIIEDNGIGRNNINDQLQKNKVSYGIDMSSERVKLFNNEEKTSVHITDLFSKGKSSGTRVTLYLKVD